MSDSVETKLLIKMNERFLNVAQTVGAFKNNVKALKICSGLVNLEIKEIKKSKQPIDSEKMNKILWRYIDLKSIIKILIKSKNIQELSKTYADIQGMISVTEKQLAELKAPEAVGNFSATSQKIVNAINDTAQKIGDAVSGKIDGLKKMFAVEESSESE